MADREDEEDKGEKQREKVEDPKQVVNYIKRWLKFQRLHRQLPLSIPIPQNAQQLLDSQAFLLLIYRIEGLPKPQNQEMTLGIRIIANMFLVGDVADKANPQTKINKCFFGRTYESPPIPVEFMPDGASYEHQPINIYYHTKISGQNSPLVLILEVQINELGQGDLIYRRQTLGWIELSATALSNGPVKATIRKGSPRVLLNQQQPQSEFTNYSLLYELVHSQSFQLNSFLIPENVLIGYRDEVPGIKDNFIPPIQSPKDDLLELVPTFATFISNIQVFIPDQLEQEVYKQVQRYRSYKYRISEDFKGDIQITQKRLVAAYHNGWNIINSRGLNNFVPLADSRKTLSINVEGRQVPFKVLEYQGVIDVNNVAGEDPESENNFEYEATFQVNNIGKQTMQITMGWLPVYINDKIGMPQESIEEEFIIGPGKTITGKPMAYFQAQDLPIKLVAVLNLQGTGGQAVRDIVKQTQQQQQQSGMPSIVQTPAQDRFKATSGDHDIDIKSQLKLRDFEQQLSRLREENERLRKVGNTPNYMMPQIEDVRQTQQHSKELEYLQVIEKLHDENRLSQLNTSKQFEDLEKLIRMQATTQSQSQQGFYNRGGPQTGPGMDGGQSEKTNVLFDRTDLQKFRPIEHTQYPLPQATLRPISKADTAFLLQTGIPGLLDGDPEDSDVTAQELESKALRVEMEDERKDTVIIVQPLAMKIFLQNEELQELRQLGFNVPKNLYFTMHFFDLPQYQTPNLLLEFGDDTKALLFNLRNGTPLRILTSQDQTTHNIKFNIDTSTIRYNNLFNDFTQYLYRKCLLVDVWDADSKLLFGSLKIPLRGLLRQGKQSQHLLKEVDILDTNFKRIKGSLQILIRNIGRQTQGVQAELSQKDARSLIQNKTASDKALSGSTTKKRILSNKPISDEGVNKMHKTDDKDQASRISQRIKKIKMQNISIIDSREDDKNQSKAKRKLHEVQKYKDIQKPVVVRQIVQEFFSDEKVLNSFFGHAEVMPFQFKNPYNTAFTFQAAIDDPDAKYLERAEFELIHNPSEWKFWCHVKGLPEPYSFDMVKYREGEGGAKKSYYFFLEGSETITLLFKFLSFRQIDANLQFDLDAFEIAQQRGKDYIQRFIYPKHIQVYISRVEGNNMVDGMKILVEPHMQVVDHVLRYYERDNRQTKLILPPLYSFVQPPEKKPIIYVTDPNVIVEWGKNNNEIKLSLRVGEVCTINKINVLAYTDPYSSEIVGNWQIEVHSLSGVDLEVPLGQQITSKLTLPCDVTRVVRLYSSHNGVISFPDPYRNEFTLVPGKLNVIDYVVRSVQESSIRAQVNCVDYNSQDLVYSWFIKINTISQPPSAAYDIKCLEGKESKQLLSYVNSTNILTSFIFTTSHPNHIKIIDEKLQIGPMERGDIRLRMLPKTGSPAVEAKIFITDQDERIFDTVLLKIRYTYN